MQRKILFALESELQNSAQASDLHKEHLRKKQEEVTQLAKVKGKISKLYENVCAKSHVNRKIDGIHHRKREKWDGDVALAQLRQLENFSHDAMHILSSIEV